MIVWQKADENSEEFQMIIETARGMTRAEIVDLIYDDIACGGLLFIAACMVFVLPETSLLSLWLS